MKWKLLDDGPEKTWALILAASDKAASSITGFAREKGLSGSHFTAIGGFSRATLGYFDWEAKTCLKIPVHAHVVVGLRDGSTRGGRLLEGFVRPTLEIVIAESPKNLEKKFDPSSQLALISV